MFSCSVDWQKMFNLFFKQKCQTIVCTNFSIVQVLLHLSVSCYTKISRCLGFWVLGGQNRILYVINPPPMKVIMFTFCLNWLKRCWFHCSVISEDAVCRLNRNTCLSNALQFISTTSFMQKCLFSRSNFFSITICYFWIFRISINWAFFGFGLLVKLGLLFAIFWHFIDYYYTSTTDVNFTTLLSWEWPRCLCLGWQAIYFFKGSFSFLQVSPGQLLNL